jgi:hypothetical protein
MLTEEHARKILYARGHKNAYTMGSDQVFRYFAPPLPKKPEQKISPQKKIDDFSKATGAAFNPVNPRTVASCKRYYEAGIAGDECKMVLQQAQQYERMMGREIFGIDTEKISIYSILPRIIFGMTERNIIFIKNWYSLPPTDKQVLSPYFDYRGVALPGKSGVFIKDQLPKGRQEKRMFETFNIVHGLNIEVTPEGYIFVPHFQDFDTHMKDLLEFYFTPDGYAKMYFQNGFLSRLGLRLREHVPSKIKTREELLGIFARIKATHFTPEQAKKIIQKKNPSLRTNIEKMDPIFANHLLSRYRIYILWSSFFKEELMLLGTTSLADEVFKLDEDYEKVEAAIAVTYYNKGKLGIAISDLYATNPNKVAEFLDDSVKHGWIPKGCNKLDYITAHEFSHGLVHIYDLARDPIIRDIELELLSKGRVSKEVSLHAELNIKEFITDCWSEYVLSDSPRKPAMQVGDRILDFLQKKVIVI